VISVSSQVRTRPSWPAIVQPDDFGGVHRRELAGQVNLDYAATTPALSAAVNAVLAVLPAYGSVHRGGGGARSTITTDAYEAARERVARFVDAGDDHVVVFVRNTTEAINLVAATLPHPSRVLCSPLEHHANLLPWRDHDVTHLPFAASPTELVATTFQTLRTARGSRRPFDLLAVCGASNVTGEVLPLADLARIAHDAGAEIIVDAAQLAPHRRISVSELDLDYLALSGHKLYAPFGTGALVIRRDRLAATAPLLKGGGAVRVVTLDDVAWADLPQRFEAGTPNVLGAVALAASCDMLDEHGRDLIEAQESELAQVLWDGLAELPGCRVLRQWDTGDRVAVATFTLAGRDPRQVAETLARDHGIALRSGLFCAHPFVTHLLGAESQTDAAVARARIGGDVTLPGALRASIGIGVEADDIAQLLSVLHGL